MNSLLYSYTTRTLSSRDFCGCLDVPSDSRKKKTLEPHWTLEGVKEKPKRLQVTHQLHVTFGSAFTIKGRARETSIIWCYLSNTYLANRSDHVRGYVYPVH
uniref:Uncharacterized protein n=1 Tax=Arundo donax TaxID=35708 RepID=A0A0A9F5T5_ARUDO